VDLKRRWKSVSLKVQHLRLELELRDEELRKLEEQFNKELLTLELEDLDVEKKVELFGTPDISPPTPDGEVESAVVSDSPEDVKKLWRAVAAAAHPDKTNNDPHKTELYKKAVAAWNQKSYDELYNIAIELNIEPPELTEPSLEILQNMAKELETQIQSKQNSLLWLWGSGPRERKNAIIDVYLKSRGKKRKQ
jgi:hypothetical protein